MRAAPPKSGMPTSTVQVDHQSGVGILGVLFLPFFLPSFSPFGTLF